MTIPLPQAEVLPTADAATYADWFACLADPTRVRLLHAVATSPKGITVGSLTEILRISQSTCSHHVRKLAEVGFVLARRRAPPPWSRSTPPAAPDCRTPPTR